MQGSLFDLIPDSFQEELTDVLVNNSNVRIKRIISKGHKSPENFWYDQDENEWVLLIKGSANIKFENDTLLRLTEGDYLNIPAHTKHRVEMTSGEGATIWLAIFY